MVFDIFCEVIDNYGDAGVVYRLIKDLLEDAPDARIRLIVDRVSTVAALVPSVDPALRSQGADGFTIHSRNHLGGKSFFFEDPADIIVQAFGCEIPAYYLDRWTKSAPSRFLTHRLILLLEYLTAEKWSCEYHLLPSLLPYEGVKKFFFVPSFLTEAGGLILGKAYLRKKASARADNDAFRRGFLQKIGWNKVPSAEKSRWLSVFSYEHNYSHLVRDLLSDGRPWLVFIPPGKAREGALRAFSSADDSQLNNGRLKVVELEFLPQPDYDELLLCCDFNIVRGEESWVRAVLSGKPYLWQAYLQKDAYQMVKVEAFLQAWRPHFLSSQESFGAAAPTPENFFSEISQSFRDFNRRLRDDAESEPAESYAVFFRNLDSLGLSCEFWADFLIKNCDLTRRMLDFIARFRI